MSSWSTFAERNPGAAVGRDGISRELKRVAPSQSLASLRSLTDAFFEVLESALLAGKRIEIRGFGTLRAHRRNQRVSYVPSKGKMVKVDARWVVRFDVGKPLKLRLMKELEK